VRRTGALRRTPVAAAPGDLAGRLDDLLGALPGPPAAWGALVWDIDAARVVYARDERRLFVPASNQKLVTTAAALLRWGGGHRFPTVVCGPPPAPDGTVAGDLYLKGFGDPTLARAAYQRRELHLRGATVEEIARRLWRAGVRRVEGDLVADDSWFDAERRVAGWRPSLAAECGALGALTVDGARAGERPVADPALHAGRALLAALRRRGVAVTGAVRRGLTPAGLPVLATVRSAPLAAILRRMDKDSDNFVAEILLKGLGKDAVGLGSTAAGAAVCRAALRECGLAPGEAFVADGSGLSSDNRLSPLGLVRLLVALRQRPDFRVTWQALAVAGRDGTVRDRLRDTAAAGNAHVKTGTLADSVCLSGYVRSANGHRLAFAIMVNGEALPIASVEATLDGAVAALAGADLPGPLRLAAWPGLRQVPVSASGLVHPRGGELQPCVQP